MSEWFLLRGPRAPHVLTALAAFALLLVGLPARSTRQPSWPYNVLPDVFLGLLAAGVVYFLFLRAAAPERLAQIEAETLGED
ncbi:MAG: hypothetical protein ACLPJJ_07350 [Acidocella sp.]|uniref:hypothetical protein n=1 Tax=Acidocella sp. TaxID=50710 RepID=UPI003FBDA88A